MGLSGILSWQEARRHEKPRRFFISATVLLYASQIILHIIRFALSPPIAIDAAIGVAA